MERYVITQEREFQRRLISNPQNRCAYMKPNGNPTHCFNVPAHKILCQYVKWSMSYVPKTEMGGSAPPYLPIIAPPVNPTDLKHPLK